MRYKKQKKDEIPVVIFYYSFCLPLFLQSHITKTIAYDLLFEKKVKGKLFTQTKEYKKIIDTKIDNASALRYQLRMGTDDDKMIEDNENM